MTVYVDDMQAGYGRMKMCHMVATTVRELHEMAALIGVDRRWAQDECTSKLHYDISLSKRRLAVKNGAVEITLRQLACMVHRRRFTGQLGSPKTAVAWVQSRVSNSAQR